LVAAIGRPGLIGRPGNAPLLPFGVVPAPSLRLELFGVELAVPVAIEPLQRLGCPGQFAGIDRTVAILVERREKSPSRPAVALPGAVLTALRIPLPAAALSSATLPA
jgi:hypothetical protein